MDATLRKPFEGVTNIIRFNWHFYLIALLAAGIPLAADNFLPHNLHLPAMDLTVLALATTVLSLAISFYIYDYSEPYSLHWLNEFNIQSNQQLLNINAGFDETSFLIANRYPQASLRVVDFYDPMKHTEISIKRARRLNRTYPGTKVVMTGDLRLEQQSADYIFVFFSAHEIRNRQERIWFFRQLKEALMPNGRIVVVEHLRDVPNFIAYNLGFLHFFSSREWKHNFWAAGLHLEKEQKITYFLSAFTLLRNGATS